MDENQGVILSVIRDAVKTQSFLLILNAHSFEELGRAYFPHYVPLEFHGLFMSGI